MHPPSPFQQVALVAALAACGARRSPMSPTPTPPVRPSAHADARPDAAAAAPSRPVAPAAGPVAVSVAPAHARAVEPACAALVRDGRVALHPGPADLAYQGEHGLVWTIRVGTGTDPRMHVQPFVVCFFVQRALGEPAVLAHSLEGGAAVVGLLSGGELVLHAGRGRSRGVRVAADGAATEWPMEVAGRPAVALAAYDDGVVLQGQALNASAPIWFVPWGAGRAPDAAAAFALTDPPGAPYPRETFLRTGSLLVWSTDRLHVFDLARRARRDYAIGRVARWFPMVRACDGETAVFRGASVGGGATQPGFLLADGGALPGQFVGEPVAVRARFAYVLEERRATGDLRYALVAHDLDTPGASRGTELASLPARATVVTAPDGLLVWDGAAWRPVGWLAR